MDKRIGWSAGIVAFVCATVLAIYQVQQEKLPENIFIALLVILSIMGFLAFAILVHSVSTWAWSGSVLRQYSLRSPFYRRDKINPWQWLIDIANKQKNNPSTHIVLTDSIWFSYNRDAALPCLKIKVYYKYLGVYTVFVGQPEGRVVYKGEELPDLISGGAGRTHLPPEGNLIFDLDIYIPEKFKEDVCAELDSGTGEIRNLSLNKLKAKIQVEDEAEPIEWYIAPEKIIIRQNR